MTRETVLRMVARGDVFVDFATDRLWDGSARIFSDEASAIALPAASVPFANLEVRPPAPLWLKVGRGVQWCGARCVIEVVTGDVVWLRRVGEPDADLIRIPLRQAEQFARDGTMEGVDGDVVVDVQEAALEEWNAIDPKQRATAERRYRVIHPVLQGARLPVQRRRTVQRWRDAYRLAQARKGNGLLGLVPNWSRTGRPLPAPMGELIEKALSEIYMTPTAKSFKATYGDLAHRAVDAMLPVPHQRTVRRHLRRRHTNDVIRARAGDAVAYQTEPWLWHLEKDSPVHGGWPWHIGHLDHTLLDIELVSSRTGENLGRPWWSVMQDAYSRRVLAQWLTFDPPSYRSTLMALRVCVAKHGRLPQILVVDNGPDFGSTIFEQALAWYGVEKRERPPRQPRFGATLERLLGVTTQQLIHNLAGNTKATKNVRQMTRAVDPKHNADYDLQTMSDILTDYLANGYEREVHASLRSSPADMFDRGMASGGERLGVIIPYTNNFVISLLPTTDTGKAKVDPNQGVTVNYLAYWCAAFAGPGVAGSMVPVRFDPFDLSYCWAYVKDTWHRCIVPSFPGGWPRTQRELMIASVELKAEFKEKDPRFRVSAQTLAEHLNRAEASAKLAMQRRHDREAAILIDSPELRPSDDWHDRDAEEDEREPSADVTEVDGSSGDPIDWRTGMPEEWTPYE